MKQRVSRLPLAGAARLTLPFLIMGVCVWMLSGQVDLNLASDLSRTIAALPLLTCLGASALCALSLWAVARYDGLAHRHFQTGVRQTLACKSGFAAIAVAQTVGFGVFSGAAVRWRMLPELGLKSALQLSTFVALTFIGALAFLTAVICIVLPPAGWMALPALAVCAALIVLVMCLSFAKSAAPLRHRIGVPSLRSIGAILGWSAVDVVAAAGALFLLLPTDALSFAVFLPVFMLAVGAAVASGAPGGVGPFELTLIALLPQVPTADLVTAIIVFRVLYYAVPAGLAIIVIFATKRGPQPKPRRDLPARPVLPSGANPELHILAQNNGHLAQTPHGTTALWQTNQTTTQLFDPIAGSMAAALDTLRRAADRANRIPCVYKCNARSATSARQAGWTVARIAQDCVIPLRSYDVSQPQRRGLRRKLRKAEKSGVTIMRAGHLPMSELARVDAAWQTAQGPARGGTMGRFDPFYLENQEIFLAYRDDRLIGFASFHIGATSLCLDLMRHMPSVPDGTMHLLIQSAIDAAITEGKTTLSLAAIPNMPHWTTCTGPFAAKFTNPGLAQFKRSFAPDLQQRYAAAPSPGALAIALADITTEVHWPAPLTVRSAPHNQDEDYEVALNSPAWKRIRQAVG